jgi:hypothetical protein
MEGRDSMDIAGVARTDESGQDGPAVSYKRAFTAFRKDAHWKRKIGLGVLISLIPYVGMVWMMGWEMQYQRRVAWGDDEHLPDWTDFKGQALLGLKGFVAALPYTLPISFVSTIVLIVMFTVGAVAVPRDTASIGLGIAVAFAVWFLLTITLSVLIAPLTSSVTLRVALFGDLQAGFQLKEIWRLMRAGRSELLRAWGFSTLNLGMSTAVLLLFLGVVGLAIAHMPGSSEERALAILLVGNAAYLVYMVLGLTVSLFLGLMNMHLFGSYGRAVYELGEAQGRSEPGAPSGSSGLGLDEQPTVSA